MFSRTIVATDLSTAAFAVVRNLSGFKAYGTEECLLLACLSMPQVSMMALAYTYPLLEKTLQEHKTVLENEGFAVNTRIVPGMATLEISRITAEEKYSLVVAGAECRSLVSEVLLFKLSGIWCRQEPVK